MKKIFVLVPVLIILILISVFLVFVAKNQTNPYDDRLFPSREEPGDRMGIENPASAHCEENGGDVEIITLNDGSQIGLCNLPDYSCEEWAYMNGECDFKKDEEQILNALRNKGLNLNGMKVVIYKHMGKYIEGGVVPVSEPAGGGYVFAVKDGGEVKVLADGNGIIMCSSFKDYPDFPSYLVPQCIDAGGEIVQR